MPETACTHMAPARLIPLPAAMQKRGGRQAFGKRLVRAYIGSGTAKGGGGEAVSKKECLRKAGVRGEKSFLGGPCLVVRPPPVRLPPVHRGCHHGSAAVMPRVFPTPTPSIPEVAARRPPTRLSATFVGVPFYCLRGVKVLVDCLPSSPAASCLMVV